MKSRYTRSRNVQRTYNENSQGVIIVMNPALESIGHPKAGHEHRSVGDK